MPKNQRVELIARCQGCKYQGLYQIMRLAFPDGKKVSLALLYFILSNPLTFVRCHNVGKLWLRTKRMASVSLARKLPPEIC